MTKENAIKKLKAILEKKVIIYNNCSNSEDKEFTKWFRKASRHIK